MIPRTLPAHHARLRYLTRDTKTHALAGGGALRACGGCGAHVLQVSDLAQPCPRCGELPHEGYLDEGLERVHAALDARLTRGGLDVPRGDR